MANFETTEDLRVAALERAGELVDGTSDYHAIALEQINALYRSLHAGGNEFAVDLGEVWEWAKARPAQVLTLLAPFETGTVALVLDSTSATLSSSPSASLGSFENWFLIPEGSETVYRITAHTAGATAITLDQAWLEASASKNFKIVKLDYDLTAGIERLAQEMDVFGSKGGTLKAECISQATFDRLFPRILLAQGSPQKFCIVKQLNGQFTVRFSHYVSENTRVEYNYIPIAQELVSKTFTADAASDVCTAALHRMQDGQQVKLTSTTTLPGGLSLETVYYVRDSAANTFKLAATSGGSAIDITSAGTGTHTIAVIPRLPWSQRKVLFYAAAHFILVDKSDSRADYYYRQTQATLQAMVNAERKLKRHTNPNRGRMISRQDGRSTVGSFHSRIPWGYDA